MKSKIFYLIILLIFPGIIFAQDVLTREQILENIQEQIILIQKTLDKIQKQISALIAQITTTVTGPVITIRSSNNLKEDINILIQELNKIQTNYDQNRILEDLETIIDFSKQLTGDAFYNNSLDSTWKLWTVYYDLLSLRYEIKNRDLYTENIDKTYILKRIKDQIENANQALQWLNQNNIYKTKEELTSFILFLK